MCRAVPSGEYSTAMAPVQSRGGSCARRFNGVPTLDLAVGKRIGLIGQTRLGEALPEASHRTRQNGNVLGARDEGICLLADKAVLRYNREHNSGR